jgi:hypothetical protein
VALPAEELSDDGLLESFVELTSKRVALLDRVAAVHRSSAFVLRSQGRELEASEAERAAARTRLLLDEPRATQRMFASVRALRGSSGRELVLERALDGAMSLMGADFGNVQLRDRRSGELRIAAQVGFGEDFLEHFAAVADDGSACGRAASRRAQVVVADVSTDEAFEPHRRIAAASGFRAVLSTPIVSPTGRLIGVVSTHFREPRHLSEGELLLIGWYVDRITGVLARERAPGRRAAAERRPR